MRSRLAFLFAATMLITSGRASAQPLSLIDPTKPDTFYVCTAGAQVVKFSGGTGTVVYTGTGKFSDCAVGPDGGLYIGNDTPGNQPNQVSHRVIRVYPGETTESTVATLPSTARALAFNVKTLYINTAADGIYRVVGSGTSPLSFAPSSAAAVAWASRTPPPPVVVPAGGSGLTFDVQGNMVFASGTRLLRSTTPQYVAAYSGPADLGVNAGTPFGLALNTCKNIVVADPSSRRLKFLTNNGTSVQNGNLLFDRKELPFNLEIDSSNRAYVLVAEDQSGTNAKVLLIKPTAATATDGGSWIANCSDLTVVRTLADLKGSLSGPNAISGLTSAQAVGIAVAPTAHRLSFQLTKTGCSTSHDFDFGHHVVTMNFPQCPASAITITVEAHQSLIGDVAFNSSVFNNAAYPNIHAVPYSSLGGLPVEYVLKSSSSLTAAGVVPTRIKYAFFTQESLAQPGLARSPDDHVGSPGAGEYGEDVTSDFWDIGLLDAAGGERENDFSKRVVYNSNAKYEGCQFVEANGEPLFDQPLETGKPLFNGPQNIKISIGISGSGCNNGTVRVSIMRIGRVNGIEVSAVPQTVRSNSQNSNLMDSLNGKYTFNLDATALDTTGATKNSPAEFKITLSGNVDAPVNKTFFVEKQ